MPIDMNAPSYFFSINHITNETSTKRIYGIRLNKLNYFLGKTTGIVDCEQLDTNPAIAPGIFKEICSVITEFEDSNKEYLDVESINKEITNIIKRKGRPKA